MEQGPVPTSFPKSGPTLINQYGELQRVMKGNLARSMATHPDSFGELHQLEADLGNWGSLATENICNQLEIARQQLALAAHCAAAGMYRQAYSGLRLFLELSFAAVYFSVNEFEYRRWSADKIDYSWSKGLDSELGLLSKEFVEAFQPSLVDVASDFARDASDSYRHCSQFIHGKATQSRDLPTGLSFSDSALQDWFRQAKKSGEAVMFLLIVRYAESVGQSQLLIDVLTARFGHLNGVRTLIGLADA